MRNRRPKNSRPQKSSDTSEKSGERSFSKRQRCLEPLQTKRENLVRMVINLNKRQGGQGEMKNMVMLLRKTFTTERSKRRWKTVTFKRFVKRVLDLNNDINKTNEVKPLYEEKVKSAPNHVRWLLLHGAQKEKLSAIQMVKEP